VSQNSMIPKKKQFFKHNEDIIRITTYVILLFTFILFVLGETVPFGSWRFYATILCLTGILLINFFEDVVVQYFSEESNGLLFHIGVSMVLTLLAAGFGKFFNLIFIIFMIAAQSFITLKPRLAALATSIFIGIFMVIMGFIGLGTEGLINMSISLVVGMVFVVTLSLVLKQYAAQTERAEKLAMELQAANQELVEARQREKELAVAEERVRLARDIHDGLGHHLTALNIQLQAVEKMLYKKPDQAFQAVQVCRQEAKAALEEVRHSVAVMRRSPLDGRTLQEALHQLVQEFRESSGKSVNLDIQADIPDLDANTAATIFRAVQEGLTNIRKHAVDAQNISILLACHANLVTLNIQDDGKSAADDQVSSSFGLAGLMERAEQLGGRLTSRNLAEGGYCLTMEIPITGETV